LTLDLDKLEEKREQARQRALLDPEDQPPVVEDDTARKVNALYAALEGIERVTPVVPGILERLRGMRVVHADAAGVTTGIKEANVQMERMGQDFGEWREALTKVEGGLDEARTSVQVAVERVEVLLKGLEERIDKL
jgi:nuclear migration protein JNM1